MKWAVWDLIKLTLAGFLLVVLFLVYYNLAYTAAIAWGISPY